MKAIIGMELSKAQLCQPCSLIVETTARCPFCGGIALVPVSEYLPVVRESAKLVCKETFLGNC